MALKQDANKKAFIKFTKEQKALTDNADDGSISSRWDCESLFRRLSLHSNMITNHSGEGISYISQYTWYDILYSNHVKHGADEYLHACNVRLC